MVYKQAWLIPELRVIDSSLLFLFLDFSSWNMAQSRSNWARLLGPLDQWIHWQVSYWITTGLNAHGTGCGLEIKYQVLRSTYLHFSRRLHDLSTSGQGLHARRGNAETLQDTKSKRILENSVASVKSAIAFLARYHLAPGYWICAELCTHIA